MLLRWKYQAQDGTQIILNLTWAMFHVTCNFVLVCKSNVYHIDVHVQGIEYYILS